mmetsp:Transcript_14311/g.19953  ORF Transcript_14311/g.19953 Transcript_14311/m.19953 type:complete len:372 (+) Transcript_14311:145-1260(+)
MNLIVERMENIPDTQLLKERLMLQRVPHESQNLIQDDPHRNPSKIKVEEKDQTRTQNSATICDLTSKNADQTTSDSGSIYPVTISSSSSHFIDDTSKVSLFTNSSSRQQQKLLPSLAQTPTPRPSKISINDLLNNDNSNSCTELPLEPSHLPNLLSLLHQRKRNFEQTSADEPAPLDSPPVEAQIVSVPNALISPTPVSYMSPYVTYSIPYAQAIPPVVNSVPAQPVSVPSDPLLAMAAAASELSEAPSTNAGSPTDPTSPVLSPGPIQELYDELWMKHFNQLKEFKAQFGHCNVTRTKAEWKSLGNWVAEQRRKMRQGKLTQQQYDMLSVLGFEWDRSYFFKAAVPVQPMYADMPPPNESRKKIQRKSEE